MFRDQKDKLSYFDFFQFVEHTLNIKLKNWEEDALEGRLDRLGMAFIEFNEFNEFCMDYNIDFGEPLLETDLEDILDAKLNLSYKDYKLSKYDYFQGCPTMLTSEKAALAKVSEIYSQYKAKANAGQPVGKFIDVDFGARRKSDLERSKFCMYKTGEVPRKGYTDPKQVEWMYAQDLTKKPVQFVDDGVASDDCIQGNLGDCWLISAMSVLATRDELLVGGRQGMEYDNNMIVDKEIASILSKGVYPPIFHKYRKIGLYVIRIFKNFTWIYVIVDERIPIDLKPVAKSKKDFAHEKKGEPVPPRPVFGRCRSAHELWVPLIEKAYAKMHGCYENLISGYVDEGI